MYIAYGNIEQNNNDFEGVGMLKSTFESVNESDEGGPKRKRIESTALINKACSKADHVVTSEATIDEYDLNFPYPIQEIINFDGELML